MHHDDDGVREALPKRERRYHGDEGVREDSMTDDIDDPFLTIDEAARVLHVSRRTLDNYRYRKQVRPTGAMAAASSAASAISSHGPSSAGRDIRKATRVRRHRLSTLALLAAASLAILFPRSGAPVLVWNASPSVPIGLYRLTSRVPLTGALAVIRLPEPLRILAETRGYLRKGALLIKPVAAGAGDTVCRHGPRHDDVRPHPASEDQGRGNQEIDQ